MPHWFVMAATASPRPRYAANSSIDSSSHLQKYNLGQTISSRINRLIAESLSFPYLLSATYLFLQLGQREDVVLKKLQGREGR